MDDDRVLADPFKQNFVSAVHLNPSRRLLIERGRPGITAQSLSSDVQNIRSSKWPTRRNDTVSGMSCANSAEVTVRPTSQQFYVPGNWR